MVHDAEKLVKFAQRLIEFADTDNVPTAEALEFIRHDPEEQQDLMDLYVTCYNMYFK